MPDARPGLRTAVPSGERGSAVGAGSIPRCQRVLEPGPACGGGPAADAGHLGHLPRLDTSERDRRPAARLLRPPALRLEDLGRDRDVGAGGHDSLRAGCAAGPSLVPMPAPAMRWRSVLTWVAGRPSTMP